MEKKLSLLLQKEGLSANLTPTTHSWKEIQEKLKPEEALVEITRIRYHDKQWTDSVLYVAFVVKKNSPCPEMVIFPNGNQMEGRYARYYLNAVQIGEQEDLSYRIFFEPLSEHLQGINKLYFSGDGIYHQLNPATVFHAVTGKYLDEEMDIRLISTARDFIALGKNRLNQQRKAYELYLFGYPAYGGKGEQKAQEERSVSALFVIDIDKSQRFFDTNTGQIATLPGTKTEVNNIEGIARQAQISCKTFLWEQASEEVVKSLQAPGILHIATHGFFLAEKPTDRNTVQGDKTFDNPLLRSGLLLAGAELTLNKKSTGRAENGILTAQEALSLDLQGTELVVLSACETGLGEVKSGEGVFGLQRALQEAGAGAVIMSLWKVDDAATQQFMTLFYRNLLVKNLPKQEAFTAARQAIKEKYVIPYYWGAFVMIGE